MKVFISWSGRKSHEVAKILENKLDDFNPCIEPFISSNIPKGTEWYAQITTAISDSKYAIFCLTPESLMSDWLKFEFGALMNSLDNKNVSPFLFDIEEKDLKDTPFAHMQVTSFSKGKEEIYKLIQSINASVECGHGKISDDKLKEYFNLYYEGFEKELKLLYDKEENSDKIESRKKLFISLQINELYKWKTEIVNPIWELLYDNSIKFSEEYYGINTTIDNSKTKDFKTIFDIYDEDKLSKSDDLVRLKNPISGMLAPLTLCEGNINEIKNDWKKVITDYSKNFKESKYLLPYSYQTIWRMWGPSKEHYLYNNAYEILQFGYGDENNSIPVVIEKELIEGYEIKQNLTTPIKTDGVVMSLKNNRLTKYITKLNNILGGNVASLSEKFSKIMIIGRDLNEKVFGFKALDPLILNKNNKDFYSAYIWAQLHIEDFGDFVIFEHGNITRNDLLDEYIELLSMKIKHVINKYGESNVKLKDCFLKRMTKPIVDLTGINLTN